MTWTIAFNGIEKTLADWGLVEVKRTLVSQGLDALSFRAAGQPVDALPLFPYLSSLTLFRDRAQNDDGSFSSGTSWFTGIVTQTPSAGSPQAEDMRYVVSGPWWYLEHLVFQQALRLITGYAGNPPAPVYDDTRSSTHLFLNVAPIGSNPNGNGMLNTAQQIIEALNWALKPFVDADTNPPFQLGSILPGAPVFVPHDEVRDITCAEVIVKELRWTPDAVTWFDYTTTPPTFNCQRRSDLPASVNLDMSNT